MANLELISRNFFPKWEMLLFLVIVCVCVCVCFI